MTPKTYANFATVLHGGSHLAAFVASDHGGAGLERVDRQLIDASSRTQKAAHRAVFCIYSVSAAPAPRCCPPP
jgi:hypothetical protein